MFGKNQFHTQHAALDNFDFLDFNWSEQVEKMSTLSTVERKTNILLA